MSDLLPWVALALGLLNLAVWVVLALLARRLYRKAKPMLSMLGLGGKVGGSAGPPVGSTAIPVAPVGGGGQATAPTGALPTETVPAWDCDAPPGFRCPTPDYCAREGCQY